MYSIVLGLEVLGNPVGFIKGFKDGAISLFYHPIQVKTNHSTSNSMLHTHVHAHTYRVPYWDLRSSLKGSTWEGGSLWVALLVASVEYWVR